MTFALMLSAAFAQDGTLPLDSVQADFVCVSPQATQEPLIGVPPIEVTCEVALSDLFTWDEAHWTFGDGTTGDGDVVTHSYEVPGQFGISLTLDGLRYAVDDTGPDPVVEPERTKYGLVTACDTARVEFTVEKRAGLKYELFNRTDFLPGCVDDVQWTVVKGQSRDGEVVFEEVAWEPVVVLPDDGTYTIFLDVYGLAGGSAAKLTIDAVYGVDERLQGSSRWGCDTSTGAAGAFALLASLMLVRRRS